MTLELCWVLFKQGGRQPGKPGKVREFDNIHYIRLHYIQFLVKNARHFSHFATERKTSTNHKQKKGSTNMLKILNKYLLMVTFGNGKTIQFKILINDPIYSI